MVDILIHTLKKNMTKLGISPFHQCWVINLRCIPAPLTEERCGGCQGWPPGRNYDNSSPWTYHARFENHWNIEFLWGKRRFSGVMRFSQGVNVDSECWTGLYPKCSKYLRVKGVLSTLLDQGFKGSNMPSEERLRILQLKHRESFFFKKSLFHSIPYCKLRPELGTTWNTYINIHPLPFHDNIFNKPNNGQSGNSWRYTGFP